jgi:hypothetical protein
MDLEKMTLAQLVEIDFSCLTLDQLRQLAGNPKHVATISNGDLLSGYTGKYVIVRSRNEGINAGVVKAADETGIVLTDARRIWYHKPKDRTTSWYEGVAMTGLSDDSKISVAVEEKAIIEDYSITVCTKSAAKSIQNHKAHEQN